MLVPPHGERVCRGCFEELGKKREPVDVCWYRRRGPGVLVCRGCFQGEEEIKSNVIYRCRYCGSLINSLCFNFPSIHLKVYTFKVPVPVLVRCSCGVPVLESFYRYRYLYSYVSCSMNRMMWSESRHPCE